MWLILRGTIYMLRLYRPWSMAETTYNRRRWYPSSYCNTLADAITQRRRRFCRRSPRTIASLHMSGSNIYFTTYRRVDLPTS